MNENMPLIPAPAPAGSVAARHWDKIEADKTVKAATVKADAEPEPLAASPLDRPDTPPQPPQLQNSQPIQDAEYEQAKEERELSRPLREIADEYQRIVAVLVENDGELGEEYMDLWRELNGDTPEKLEKCGLHLRNLETAEAMADAQVDVFGGEMKRLQQRAKAKTNEVLRFRSYIIDQMVRLERLKHEGPEVRLTVIKNNPLCDVIDAERVPDEFCKVTVEMSAVEWAAVKVAAGAIAATITDGFTEFDVKRTPDKKAIVTNWRQNQEQTQTPGTIVSRSNRLGLR